MKSAYQSPNDEIANKINNAYHGNMVTPGGRLTQEQLHSKNIGIIKKFEDIKGKLMAEANKEYYSHIQNPSD